MLVPPDRCGARFAPARGGAAEVGADAQRPQRERGGHLWWSWAVTGRLSDVGDGGRSWRGGDGALRVRLGVT